MAVTLPNGSLVAIASGYGTAKTVSAITNANPGVATSAAHGFTDGDILEVTSGWSRLTNKIVRVDGAATGMHALELADQFVAADALEQVAGRPDPHGLEQVLLVVVDRQQNDLLSRIALADVAAQIKPADTGHDPPPAQEAWHFG